MLVKWRQVERAVMQQLGFKPTALSGGGWLEKEDGESDNVLAQLKSTAGKSISVKHQDLKDLIKHSRVSHKLPVFVLYFVGDEPYVLVRAGDLKKAAKYVRFNSDGNKNTSNKKEVVKDAKSQSGGARRPINPPNPVQIRGTVSKAVRRSNPKVSDRGGIPTVRTPSSNRSRQISGSGTNPRQGKATSRASTVRRVTD